MTSKTMPAVPVGKGGGTDVPFFCGVGVVWVAVGMLIAYLPAGWMASGTLWWTAFAVLTLVAMAVILLLVMMGMVWWVNFRPRGEN